MTTDVWASYATLDHTTQQRLAAVLETRGADPQQQALRRSFLADVRLPAGAHVVDVGCGTGVLTRMLARWTGIATVVGVDVAPLLLERARTLAAGVPGVTFAQGDACALPFDDGTVDAVVFDSALSHIADTARALTEAHRVLRPGGRLAVFDGDYATTTVALGAHDPLQCCAEAMMASSVTHPWLMRRLGGLVRDCDLDVERVRSHGFVETTDPAYMLTVVDRGADILRARGQISAETAAALQAEARSRAQRGRFWRHIAYASLVAQRGAAAAGRG